MPEPEPEEMVSLTVSLSGGLGHMTANPAAGVYRYTKGTVVTLTAEPHSYARSVDDPELDVSRAPLTGFVGSGSVPAFGTTNELVVTLTEDSSVEWRWADTVAEHRFCVFIFNDGEYEDVSDYYIFNDGIFVYNWLLADDRWLPAGSQVLFRPSDTPFDERYQYVGEVYYYNRSAQTWNSRFGQLDFRLGALGLTECGNLDDAPYQYDERGRMPVPLTVTMDRPFDLYAVYYNAEEQSAGYPPFWWYMRYLCGAELYHGADSTLTGDPDGDGFDNGAEYAEATDPVDDASFPFKLRAFSPTNLVFTGSVKGSLILERQERLGDEWRGVWTNAAVRTSVSNRVDLSAWFTSNGFFRVLYRPLQK